MFTGVIWHVAGFKARTAAKNGYRRRVNKFRKEFPAPGVWRLLDSVDRR
jgi:hypothetical protein